MLGNFLYKFVLSSTDFFFKIKFLKNSFRNSIRVSNSLDPDQDQQNAGPDLDQTVCKGYKPMSKVTAIKEKVKLLESCLCLLP